MRLNSRSRTRWPKAPSARASNGCASGRDRLQEAQPGLVGAGGARRQPPGQPRAQGPEERVRRGAPRQTARVEGAEGDGREAPAPQPGVVEDGEPLRRPLLVAEGELG